MEFINKNNRRFFAYIIIDITALFVVNFYYLEISQLLLYALLIILVSFLIFLTKNFIAGFFHVKVSGTFWITGFIFSVIATVVASSFGIPILIPVISYNNYSRPSTLKGMKKGAVNVHEKWEITFLSSSLLLFAAFILITLWHVLNEKGFLMSGIALAMFVLIDFLPERRFNGANLIYHNSIIYAITFIFLLIIGILSVINYIAFLITFIVFILFIFVTYLTKLW
ncbi:hypothetical protein M1494_00045 [Candidatus Parvarchaeota archaeon]|nr:hypothetical protein [Candidatus Parvarchaeota archaeon]